MRELLDELKNGDDDEESEAAANPAAAPRHRYLAGELGSDMNLYALVFGLSVLNDAVMNHYSFSNLSENSQRFVAALFLLISFLAETFVFIYLGFDITMEQHSWSHVGFIFLLYCILELFV
ncbi:hypothetical protein L2E82_53172 [Cichorium intybus]|nr:hypothetical protein L2E82_53172 [Cichorium intybus]